MLYVKTVCCYGWCKDHQESLELQIDYTKARKLQGTFSTHTVQFSSKEFSTHHLDFHNLASRVHAVFIPQ